MSKASEWRELMLGRPRFDLIGDLGEGTLHAEVTDFGGASITSISPDGTQARVIDLPNHYAVALAYWIINTFGESK